MKLRRWLLKGLVPLGLVAGLALWLGDWPRPQRGSSEERPAPVKQTGTIEMALVGTASCSARGCHGGIEPRSGATCQQNEYSLWVRDRHADAYRVLFNDRSKKIAELLNGPKPAAHEDARCLACHTNPLTAKLPETGLLAKEEKLFGVGCESCHEGANRWLVRHTSEEWSRFKPEQKRAHHMKDVADPAVQVPICAGCHIGAPPIADGLPPRDVNHDLIAAGHPRLNFEFGAYQANMPTHWRPKQRPEGHFWAVGQLAAAQAALELLVYRAQDHKNAPWPEFAEYDCFACHHNLAVPSWRQQAQLGKRAPGSLSWGSWHFALTGRLTGDLPALDELEKIMQARSPDRQQAGAKASALLKELQGRKDAVRNDRELLTALLKIKGTHRAASWDSAEQLYLALHALNQSLADPGVTKVLEELTPIRAFHPEFDSPRNFRPEDFFEKISEKGTK